MDPTAWTCMANPSAVEPSTAPSGSSTAAASAIRAPSPPAVSGTTSRCSPDRDDRLGRPRLEGVAEIERAQAADASSRARSTAVIRVFRSQVSGLSARPAPRVLDKRRQPTFARRCLLGARDPVRHLRRYEGARRSQSAQAASSARNRASSSSLKKAAGPFVE